MDDEDQYVPDFWTEIVALTLRWMVIWGWFVIPVMVFILGVPAVMMFKLALCILVFEWIDLRVYEL